MGQYGGTVHSHWVTSQLHIWAIAALLTSPSLVAGCAITPPLPTTRQLLYLEMSRDTSAKNEPRNTPIHVTELVIIYLEIHSPYISKAISRIFSWSIVKCFEPRKCFWDSVPAPYPHLSSLIQVRPPNRSDDLCLSLFLFILFLFYWENLSYISPQSLPEVRFWTVQCSWGRRAEPN